ncbi:hypothetical protein Salpa_4499 [Sporomusa sp. KB1]|nr:hypothetical protein Salpa_4499 [Sporomusa sp. KB1]
MFYKFLIYLFSLFICLAFLSAFFSLIWWEKWDIFIGGVCGGIFFLIIMLLVKRLGKSP